MPTGGTDVKVYTVGPDYAHAEARKSPTVDGRVMRAPDGKEVRYPVLLTSTEKELARGVSLAFGQTVCGFDLLRCNGESYVCDVNGWSFVKGSQKYYDDASGILREMILSELAPARLESRPSTMGVLKRSPSADSQWDGSTFGGGTSPGDGMDEGEETPADELRCVVAVMRHADRTPKQKMKTKVKQREFMQVLEKYKGKKGEAKLKTPLQLLDVLQAVCQVLERGALAQEDPDPKRRRKPPPPGSEEEEEGCSEAFLEKLRLVKAVLQRKSREGSHFSGINRKVQLKPLAWNDDGSVKEALLIVKHGGVLTTSGLQQAEELGRTFRNVMYPRYGPGGSGLLRLHSTYRHDLKIYSSDEGRVQMSAAAFTKGLLDLEGQSLAPILVSLVTKDHPLLDAFGKGANEDIQRAKRKIHTFMTELSCESTNDQATSASERESTGNRASCASLAKLVPKEKGTSTDDDDDGDDELGPEEEHRLAQCLQGDEPRALLGRLVELMGGLVRQLRAKCRQQYGEEFEDELGQSDSPEPSREELKRQHKWQFRAMLDVPGNDETLRLMLSRWSKLLHDLYQPRNNRYDISKVPDVYDMVKYDCLHNSHLGMEGLKEMYDVAKKLADAVIPNEYGVDSQAKLAVGTKICSPLLGKILRDFRFSKHGRRSGSGRHHHAVEEGIEEDDKGMNHLNVQYTNDVHSKHRHVRTRLYFTSESHMHALVNVLRIAALEEGHDENGLILSGDGQSTLDGTSELDYLSHLVMRMFERPQLPESDPAKYRIEVYFSPGASGDPFDSGIQLPTELTAHLQPGVEHSPTSYVLPVNERSVLHPRDSFAGPEQSDSALTHKCLEDTLARHAIKHFDPLTRTGELKSMPQSTNVSSQSLSNYMASSSAYEGLQRISSQTREERAQVQGIADGTPPHPPRSALSMALSRGTTTPSGQPGPSQ